VDVDVGGGAEPDPVLRDVGAVELKGPHVVAVQLERTGAVLLDTQAHRPFVVRHD
jgi:hypothetical protein